MDEAKIKEVFSDEEFVKSLFAFETAQQVQAAIGAKGIELSVAEIETIRERILSGNGELSEQELDNVAGGVVLTTTAIMVSIFVIGAVFGTAGGIALGAAVGVTNLLVNGRW